VLSLVALDGQSIGMSPATNLQSIFLLINCRGRDY